MASNIVQELPVAWHKKINSTEFPDMYIKFVDDETNLREAQARSEASGSKTVSEAEFMHLYKLSTFVQIECMPQTFNKATEEVEFVPTTKLKATNVIPLIPTKNDDMMLYFPYRDQGQRIDLATKDLLLFGNQLFSFLDDTTYLKSYLPKPYQQKQPHSMYKTVGLNRKQYYRLKATAPKNKNAQWLSIEHMGLFFQWMERNDSSPFSQSFEII